MGNELMFKTVGTLADRNDNRIPIIKVTGPYGQPVLIYKSVLNIDWDGSAKGYGVNKPGSDIQKNLDPHETGLNNAKHKFTREWVGVYSRTESEARTAMISDKRFGATPPDRIAFANANIDNFIDKRFADSAGRFPVVQILETDPARGYYVSQAPAYADKSLDAWNQRRYLDAATVPYQALSTGMEDLGVHLHDYGLIVRSSNGNSLPLFYGDHAGKGSTHVGECSGYIKTTLAPGTNEEDELFTFIIFLNSSTGIPDVQVPQFMESVVRFRANCVWNASNPDDFINTLAAYQINGAAKPTAAQQAVNARMLQSALKNWGWGANPDPGPTEATWPPQRGW